MRIPSEEGAPLKFISDKASAAWKKVMEAERNASVHSAVDGYLAFLRQFNEPDELVSLMNAFADVKGLHPVWQYAAAGRLAQLNPEMKESVALVSQ